LLQLKKADKKKSKLKKKNVPKVRWDLFCGLTVLPF